LVPALKFSPPQVASAASSAPPSAPSSAVLAIAPMSATFCGVGRRTSAELDGVQHSQATAASGLLCHPYPQAAASRLVHARARPQQSGQLFIYPWNGTSSSSRRGAFSPPILHRSRPTPSSTVTANVRRLAPGRMLHRCGVLHQI
jgi:hypothetical protein